MTRSQPEDDKSGEEAGSQQQSANAKTQQQANIRQAREQQQSEQLKKAIMEMNRRINNSNEEAVFGVHEDTNRIMIKIMDKETKEVIKEFPPEKTLDMIAGSGRWLVFLWTKRCRQLGGDDNGYQNYRYVLGA